MVEAALRRRIRQADKDSLYIVGDGRAAASADRKDPALGYGHFYRLPGCKLARCAIQHLGEFGLGASTVDENEQPPAAGLEKPAVPAVAFDLVLDKLRLGMRRDRLA